MRLNSLTVTFESRAYAALRSFTARRSLKPAHLLTGERGEDAAYFHLVAWDGPTLVVFEVKTRTASSREAAFAPAETSVDPHKQHVLRKMASAYLHQFPSAIRNSIAVRFDILSVYQLPTGIEFEQIRNAFPLVEPVGNRRR
jgi:putative endonuclease